MNYPPSLERLIDELARLPGVGPKSAQRLAFHLLRTQHQQAEHLAQAILEAHSKVLPCPECGFFAEPQGEDARCLLCRDVRRDRGVICVVEDAKDVVALEATHEFRGLYHVLGGALSPMEGMGPEELHLPALDRRLETGRVREIILATDPDVEGEATAMFLAHWLRSRPVRVTRIARGLPMGGDLDYADVLTLVRALEGRREISTERSSDDAQGLPRQLNDRV